MIENLQNCVVLPHLPNWTQSVKHRRTWATSVASGIDGGEDRAAERTTARRKLTYTVSTLLGDGPQESEVLAGRLKAALRSGRAVCPLFGRAQAVVAVPFDATQLQVYSGFWPWVAGEYAFLSLGGHTGINQEVLIDAGGAGAGFHQPEANFTHTGGEILTTEHSIAANRDGDILVYVDGSPLEPADAAYVTPPPEAVLQSCRYDDTVTPDGRSITFTMRVAMPWRCKVRLWFCEYEEHPLSTAYRLTATGANMSRTTFSPWLAAGETPYAPTFCDLDCSPAADGTIEIEVQSAHSSWIHVCAIEVFSTCWQMIPIREIQTSDTTALLFAAAHLKFGSLADIPRIYPVLWGKPSIGDMDAVTNWHGEVEISVAEPMGDNVQGIMGLTRTELCGLPTDPVPPTIQELGPLPTGLCSSEYLLKRYDVDGNDLEPRYFSGGVSILNGEFGEWAAEQRADQLAAVGVVYTEFDIVPKSAYWQHASGDQDGYNLAYFIDYNFRLDYHVSNDYSYMECVYTIRIASQPEEADAITSSGFTANWIECPGATGYFLDVSAVSDFSALVAGYSALDVGGALFRTVTGLAAATKYYYRLRIYFGTGETQVVSPSSAARAVTTL